MPPKASQTVEEQRKELKTQRNIIASWLDKLPVGKNVGYRQLNDEQKSAFDDRVWKVAGINLSLAALDAKKTAANRFTIDKFSAKQFAVGVTEHKVLQHDFVEAVKKRSAELDHPPPVRRQTPPKRSPSPPRAVRASPSPREVIRVRSESISSSASRNRDRNNSPASIAAPSQRRTPVLRTSPPRRPSSPSRDSSVETLHPTDDLNEFAAADAEEARLQKQAEEIAAAAREQAIQRTNALLQGPRLISPPRRQPSPARRQPSPARRQPSPARRQPSPARRLPSPVRVQASPGRRVEEKDVPGVAGVPAPGDSLQMVRLRAPVDPVYGAAPAFSDAELEPAGADEEEEDGVTEQQLIDAILDPRNLEAINNHLVELNADKTTKYGNLLAREERYLLELKGAAARAEAPTSASAPQPTFADNNNSSKSGPEKKAAKQEELVGRLREIRALLAQQAADLAADETARGVEKYASLRRRLMSALADPEATQRGDDPRGILSLTGATRAPLRKKLLRMVYSLVNSAKQFVGTSNAWVIVGPAGTGKSTVARVVAHVLGQMGVLVSGAMLDARYSDIVSSYSGGTEQQMRDLLNRSLENVLFIDEVYRLAKHCEIPTASGRFGSPREQDPGIGATNEMLQFLEGDYRGLFVLIVAGYAPNTECWIDTNPGLRRRFSEYESLPAMAPGELTDVFVRRVRRLAQLNEPERNYLYAHVRDMDAKGRLANGAGDMATLADQFQRLVPQVFHRADAWNSDPRRGVDRSNIRLLGAAINNLLRLKGVAPNQRLRLPASKASVGAPAHRSPRRRSPSAPPNRRGGGGGPNTPAARGPHPRHCAPMIAPPVFARGPAVHPGRLRPHVRHGPPPPPATTQRPPFSRPPPPHPQQQQQHPLFSA